MAEDRCLFHKDRPHFGSLPLRENDIVEVNEEGFVYLKIVRILLLVLYPQLFNSPQYIRNLLTKVVDNI